MHHGAELLLRKRNSRVGNVFHARSFCFASYEFFMITLLIVRRNLFRLIAFIFIACTVVLDGATLINFSRGFAPLVIYYMQEKSCQMLCTRVP